MDSHEDGGGRDTRAGHESDSAVRDASTPESGESGAGGAATISTTEERGPTIATPSSVQKPARKLTWDA